MTNAGENAAAAAPSPPQAARGRPPRQAAAAALLARGRERLSAARRPEERAAPAAPVASSPDQGLVQRARAGDPEAFDALFVRHKDGVYACLWNLLDGDADLVEDAVGGVFLSAYRSLARFRGDAAFSTWLYRIAVNEAHARRRQKQRWMRFGLPLAAEQAGAPEIASGTADGGDPAGSLLRADEDQRLRRAVNALPEPYRTPVVLRYLNGMDSGEISRVLGRPAGTVRYQLSRALRLLRERLGEEWLA